MVCNCSNAALALLSLFSTLRQYYDLSVQQFGSAFYYHSASQIVEAIDVINQLALQHDIFCESVVNSNLVFLIFISSSTLRANLSRYSSFHCTDSSCRERLQVMSLLMITSCTMVNNRGNGIRLLNGNLLFKTVSVLVHGSNFDYFLGNSLITQCLPYSTLFDSVKEFLKVHKPYIRWSKSYQRLFNSNA